MTWRPLGDETLRLNDLIRQDADGGPLGVFLDRGPLDTSAQG
jgi:hypothetical protein